MNTIEKARRFVEEVSDAELLTDVWSGSQVKMRFRCACGREFETDWNHFRGTEKRNRRRCTQCARAAAYGEKRMGLEELQVRLVREGRSVYVSGAYENQRSVLRFRCSCGREFESTADNVLRKSGLCPKCGARLRSSDRGPDIGFIRSFAEEHGCELLSTAYENARMPLLFRCRCGETYFTSWNNFFSGGKRRCRKCGKRASSGERSIEDWLTAHGFRFEAQKRFRDCRDKRALPFDFYLPDFGLCIEFDGEQHFRPVAFGGDTARYNEIVRHDTIKDAWCAAHGFELLRIPYTQAKQIDAILSDSLILRQTRGG